MADMIDIFLLIFCVLVVCYLFYSLVIYIKYKCKAHLMIHKIHNDTIRCALHLCGGEILWMTIIISSLKPV